MSRYIRRDKQRSERALRSSQRSRAKQQRYTNTADKGRMWRLSTVKCMKKWMEGSFYWAAPLTSLPLSEIKLGSVTHTCARTHTRAHAHKEQQFLHFSSFRPRRRRGRHFNCSGEEMASFHLDGHIMNIFHFELSFTYRVSQLFSLWTLFFSLPDIFLCGFARMIFTVNLCPF